MLIRVTGLHPDIYMRHRFHWNINQHDKITIRCSNIIIKNRTRVSTPRGTLMHTAGSCVWQGTSAIGAPVPLYRILFFPIAHDRDAIANNLKQIGMMIMQCMSIYPNIYERVSDYMKIHHKRF